MMPRTRKRKSTGSKFDKINNALLWVNYECISFLSYFALVSKLSKINSYSFYFFFLFYFILFF